MALVLFPSFCLPECGVVHFLALSYFVIVSAYGCSFFSSEVRIFLRISILLEFIFNYFSYLHAF